MVEFATPSGSFITRCATRRSAGGREGSNDRTRTTVLSGAPPLSADSASAGSCPTGFLMTESFLQEEYHVNARKVYGHDVLTHLAGPYVVGADAGGTKTRCTVMTLTGAVAGSGYAPGANPNSGGDTAGSLTTALGAALGDLDPALVIAGVFGIAGAGAAGRPAAVRAANKAWRLCGLTGAPSVVTDIAVAFAAGTDAAAGIVVFAGTGAGAAFISDGTIVRRADGYGWLVGDEGSAVWIGKEAVRAALAAFDGRGQPTLLAESVPRAL